VKTTAQISSLPQPVPVDGGIHAYVIPDKEIPKLKPEILNSMDIPKK